MTTFQTATAPYSSDNAAHYIAWAQGIGKGFTALGWTAASGHGELVASGSGASYAWTNIVALPGTTVITPALYYTFRGAWVSGTTYTGGNTINASLCDLVTDAGLTYVHITASSNSATAPGADTTNWMPYNYEIWTNSGGTLGSVLPVYIRLVYGKSATANAVAMHVAIGTGVDANGNLVNAMPLTSVLPATNAVHNPSTTVSSNLYTHMFSGDTNNIRFALWKDYNVASSSPPLVLFIDYARVSDGTQSSAYVVVGVYTQTGTTAKLAFATFMSTAYGGGILASSTGSWPTLAVTASSYGAFGNIPPLPIFPLLGFLGNPALGAMCFPWADAQEGTLQPVWMYGASHNFLVIGNMLNTASSPNGISSTCKPAILWE